MNDLLYDVQGNRWQEWMNLKSQRGKCETQWIIQMEFEVWLVLKIVFEVLRVLKMSMAVFWIKTLSALVGRYQHFWEPYCLHLQGSRKLRQYVPLNVGIHHTIHMVSQSRPPSQKPKMYLWYNRYHLIPSSQDYNYNS